MARKWSYRDLGIIMSHDLSWKNHHDFILSKAYRFLGLLRRTFSTVHCNQAKKILYLSLVRSQLMYCSPIWRPQFLKDIQRRATKFITNDYSSSYKSRLVSLHMLPFMMQLELTLFFVACINKSFDISEYVTFCSGSTRSSVSFKLVHSFSRNNISIGCHVYGTPSLLSI